jgi:phosphoribosylglycinamide formyltransferase-1
MNIAVLVSGNGSNLQALMDAEKKGALSRGRITLVISDKADAYALKRAKKRGIRTVVVEAAGSSREEYDRKIIKELEENGIELVALAGFMRILSEGFIKKYENRMLNIHPALLPAFKGAHAIRDAYEHGVKVTGVTVHFVTLDVDSGPMILQEAVKIKEGESIEALEKRIHRVEHKLFPEAVRLFADGKLKINGRKVEIRA